MVTISYIHFHLDSLRIHVKLAALLSSGNTRLVNQESHKKLYSACHLTESQYGVRSTSAGVLEDEVRIPMPPPSDQAS